MSDLIKNRRSVRKFDIERQVSKEELEIMLEAAMLAPSACNSRPWEFVAITRRSTLDEIARIHPNAAMCASATAAIVVVALPQSGKPEGYFPQDCGAATQNILLSAVKLGLGACWCGVYPKQDRVESLRALLKIEEPKIPFNVIAIGAPSESPIQRGQFEAHRVTFIE